MARRATVIEELWAHDPLAEHTLLLAGSDEFLAPEGSQHVTSPALAPAFLRAYEIMGYTRIYPAQREAAWLLENGGLETLPDTYRPLQEGPVVDMFTIDGHTVAVMAFPELPAEMQEPPPALADEVIRAAREIRGQVDLLIAISPWGKWGEEHFLWHQDLPFDILLGGGAGPGSWGQAMNDGSVLWMRTFYKGRSVNLVHVLKWPESGERVTWVQGENYITDVWALYDDVPDNEQVGDLFP